jgi:hypothetical protein
VGAAERDVAAREGGESVAKDRPISNGERGRWWGSWRLG